MEDKLTAIALSTKLGTERQNYSRTWILGHHKYSPKPSWPSEDNIEREWERHFEEGLSNVDWRHRSYLTILFSFPLSLSPVCRSRSSFSTVSNVSVRPPLVLSELLLAGTSLVLPEDFKVDDAVKRSRLAWKRANYIGAILYNFRSFFFLRYLSVRFRCGTVW